MPNMETVTSRGVGSSGMPISDSRLQEKRHRSPDHPKPLWWSRAGTATVTVGCAIVRRGRVGHDVPEEHDCGVIDTAATRTRSCSSMPSHYGRAGCFQALTNLAIPPIVS